MLYERRGNAVRDHLHSPVKLDFAAPAQWSGLAPALQAALRSRGLLDANVDLGVTVPQGVMAGLYHEVDPRWAILASLGWQQWSTSADRTLV